MENNFSGIYGREFEVSQKNFEVDMNYKKKKKAK
jgi:hypothetical protein